MEAEPTIPKIDEFDQLGSPISDEEADELLDYVDGMDSGLAQEIRALYPDLDLWRYLFRPIVDDMHRIKAGRLPRYCDFDATPPAIPESTVRTPRD